MSLKTSLLCSVAALGVALLAADPVAAQTTTTQTDQATTTQTAQAQTTPSNTYNVTVTNGGIQIGGVNLKFGGFTEFATIFRTRNEVADVNSDFNTGLPLPNNPQSHERETRFSARQSRISGLVTGDVDKDTHLAAYIESDFLSAAVTSNSRESNSYSLRVRHAYATVDLDNIGFHFLGGQSWSLLTTNTFGIIPRTEQIPLVIDAQYIPGFNWARTPQARFVENFGDNIWGGLSLESPQAVIAGVAPASLNGIAITGNNLGDNGGLLGNNQTFSTDVYPDLVGKLAIDPGFGHYELKGIGRVFTDRANGSTFNTVGGGVGGAATFPVIPKLLDVQLSGLAGYGIGRYGSVQLPDVTFNAEGKEIAVPAVQALLGIVGHPQPGTDVYTYFGFEEAARTSRVSATGAGIGYGSDLANNTGCETEGGACAALTKTVGQVTLGFWQDIYKGSYGRVAVGAQGSFTKRYTFSAVGGAPYADDYMVFTSFRYYPF